MKIKIYDLVKDKLTESAETRDSDKKLIWFIWSDLGFVALNDFSSTIDYVMFMKAPSFESIRRCRQKLQEKYPELRGTKTVQKARAEKAEERGTHIFRYLVGQQEQFI